MDLRSTRSFHGPPAATSYAPTIAALNAAESVRLALAGAYGVSTVCFMNNPDSITASRTETIPMKMIGTLCAFLFFATTLSAQDVVPVSVSGQQVEKNVRKVMTTYDWGESLVGLKAQAQREKKLIFWLQMVGALDGGL